MSGIFAAYAIGLFTFVGVTGFAHAADVTAQGSRLEMVQLSMLKHDIRDTKKDQCIAYDTGSQAALTSSTQTLQELRDEYRAATNGKEDPYIPQCDEVRIKGATTVAPQ